MPTRNFYNLNYLYKTLGILVMYMIICYSIKHNLTAGKQGEAWMCSASISGSLITKGLAIAMRTVLRGAAERVNPPDFFTHIHFLHELHIDSSILTSWGVNDVYICYLLTWLQIQNILQTTVSYVQHGFKRKKSSLNTSHFLNVWALKIWNTFSDTPFRPERNFRKIKKVVAYT